MTQSHQPSVPCHNCRQRRLKCDRSRPHCSKCIQRGQTCLGYGRLLRWEQGIASRGKMAGRTFQPPSSQLSSQTELLPLRCSLTEPFFQDLTFDSRKYLLYFASDVCRDFVLYDAPHHNPFRELIPLARDNPILLQIIIANSALHMSNTNQKHLLSEQSISSASCSGSPSSSSISSSSSSMSTRHYQAYNDALIAKQRALHLLKTNLSSIAAVDVDVTLAVVLLFIEFELIDSGRDEWKHHVDGARTMIEAACRPKIISQTTMSPLRSCLISNCLVFDIFGSSLASSTGPTSHDSYSTGAMTLIRDEEGNHCSSFPTALLQLIQTGARLSQQTHTRNSCHLSDTPRSDSTCTTSSNECHQEALRLLSTAYTFDPSAWAQDIQARSPVNDLAHRAHVASAHHAAVCIYLSRVALSQDLTTQLPRTLESLVADIVMHLSAIRPHDVLFTATTWPAFIAGAETHDHITKMWVVKRFQELWQVEPWGLMRGALEVLERIWASRRDETLISENRDGTHSTSNMMGDDWIGDLRRRGVDWLIL